VSEDGTLFVTELKSYSNAGTASSKVIAINNSGAFLWSYDYNGGQVDDSVLTTPVLAGGIIYTTTQVHDIPLLNNKIVALSPLNGSLLWSAKLDDFQDPYAPSLSFPAVDESKGMLYINRIPSDDVFAFNSSGNLQWESRSGNTPPGGYSSYAPAPRLGSDLVFVLGCLRHVRALNKSTGALVWEFFDVKGIEEATFVLIGNTLIVGGFNSTSGEVGVWALNATGVVLWHYADPAWTGLEGDGYFGLSIGGLAVNSEAGVIASTAFQGETASTPIGVYCINATDGSLIWHTATSIKDTSLYSRDGLGAPSIDAAGVIFIPGQRCAVVKFDPCLCIYSLTANGTLISFTVLPDTGNSYGSRISIATPGRLYISAFDSVVALVAAPSPPPSPAPSASSSHRTVLIAGLCGLAVILLGAGVFFRYHLKNKTPEEFQLLAGSDK